MNRQILIDSTIHKIRQLPDRKIQEVNDFAEFLLNKIADRIIREGIQKLTSESTDYDFLKDEKDLYPSDDPKEEYTN